MKKSLLSIIFVSVLSAFIFLACEQNEGEGVAPTYKSEAGGGNPNPSTGTTTGTTTGGTTGGTTTGTVSATCGFSYSSYTSTAAVCSDNSVNCTSGSLYSMTSTETSTSTSCSIGFSQNCPTTPAPGSYTIVQTSPTANQCTVTFVQGSNFSMAYFATGGTVNVSLVSGKLKYSFSNIPISNAYGTTSIATGNLTQP